MKVTQSLLAISNNHLSVFILLNHSETFIIVFWKFLLLLTSIPAVECGLSPLVFVYLLPTQNKWGVPHDLVLGPLFFHIYIFFPVIYKLPHSCFFIPDISVELYIWILNCLLCLHVDISYLTYPETIFLVPD